MIFFSDLRVFVCGFATQKYGLHPNLLITLRWTLGKSMLVRLKSNAREALLKIMLDGSFLLFQRGKSSIVAIINNKRARTMLWVESLKIYN